jgi:hypothetical protein
LLRVEEHDFRHLRKQGVPELESNASAAFNR